MQGSDQVDPLERLGHPPDAVASKHRISGQEPNWMRANYSVSDDGSIQQWGGDFIETVATADPEYDCVCGESFDDYHDAMQHLRQHAGEVIVYIEGEYGQVERVLDRVPPEQWERVAVTRRNEA